MAGNDPTTHEPHAPHEPVDETAALRRRRRMRLLVPVAVAGLAAGTIGLVPALADSGGGDPDLPDTTAERLLTELAGSKVDTLSGSVRVSTDLGLPGLIAGAASNAGGSPFGPGPGADEGESDSASADPTTRLTELLSGSHTLRVAADGQDKQRVTVVGETAEYSVIHNGDEMWAYDSGSNQVFHADGAAARDAQRDAKGRSGDAPAIRLEAKTLPSTPKEAAEQVLEALDPTTAVTVDGTSEIAGRDAYDLLIKPKQSDSTVGSIRIAVDAENGAPLKFTLTPKGSGKAALDIGFSKVSFAEPAAKNFTFTPPKGAKVTEAEDAWKDGVPKGSGKDGLGLDALGAGGFELTGEGWNTVVKLKLPDGLLSGEAFKDGGEAPEGLDPQSLLKSLGDRVKGDFGGGTVIDSRLVNVLITDDGGVYAGAVTKDALVKAANEGK